MDSWLHDLVPIRNHFQGHLSANDHKLKIRNIFINNSWELDNLSLSHSPSITTIIRDYHLFINQEKDDNIV